MDDFDDLRQSLIEEQNDCLRLQKMLDAKTKEAAYWKTRYREAMKRIRKEDHDKKE